MSSMTKIAFVCVGNAGRSQMATALAERERDNRGLDIEIVTGGVDPADSVHEVQQQLGEDDEIPKADLREAALLVAYRRPDLIAEELRGWGYDME